MRIGRLTLYSLNTGSSPQLDVQSETDMPGILDIKWSYVPIADHPTIALVNSVGQLRVYNVKEDNTVAMVTEAELEPQSLGLSLEWNNMKSCRYRIIYFILETFLPLHAHNVYVQFIIKYIYHSLKIDLSS